MFTDSIRNSLIGDPRALSAAGARVSVSSDAVELDLGSVFALDASATTALVALLTRVRAGGRSIVVTAISPQADLYLRFVGLAESLGLGRPGGGAQRGRT